MLAIICTMSENQSDRTFMLELYQQFSRLMFFTARKYHLEQEACEDVVQESLVKLIQKVSVLKKMPTQSWHPMLYLQREIQPSIILSGKWHWIPMSAAWMTNHFLPTWNPNFPLWMFK